MYPDPNVPRDWTRLSGIRAYYIHHSQPDEKRWAIIHAIAIQTINAQFWDEKIRANTRQVDQLWATFKQKLISYLRMRAYEIRIRRNRAKSHYLRKVEMYEDPPDPEEVLRHEWQTKHITLNDKCQFEFADALWDIPLATTEIKRPAKGEPTRKRQKHAHKHPP